MSDWQNNPGVKPYGVRPEDLLVIEYADGNITTGTARFLNWNYSATNPIRQWRFATGLSSWSVDGPATGVAGGDKSWLVYDHYGENMPSGVSPGDKVIVWKRGEASAVGKASDFDWRRVCLRPIYKWARAPEMPEPTPDDLETPDAETVAKEPTATDAVNAPEHYTQGGIECIEAIRAALTEDEFRGYCKGNMLKYIWRERHKGGDESLRKAVKYAEFLEVR